MKIEIDSNDVNWDSLVDIATYVYAKHSLARAFRMAGVEPPWPECNWDQEKVLLNIIKVHRAEAINDELLSQFVGKTEAMIGDRLVPLSDDNIRRIALELGDELVVRRTK